MSTPKEIFLELLRPDGQPERQLRQYEALSMCFTDPINAYLRGNRKRGSTSVDRWGTTISWPVDAPRRDARDGKRHGRLPGCDVLARGGARARPRHKLRGGVGACPRGGAGGLRRGATCSRASWGRAFLSSATS